MSELVELQRQFHRAIVVGDEAEILSEIRGGHIGAAERLRIYRNNVYEGFRLSLASAFPVIERLVGQGCFRGLALDYFHSFPSQSGDLGSYGQHFAESLRRRYERSSFGYLTDVARLEWAYQEVMTEADAETLRAEDLASVSPAQLERMRLHLHPAVRIVASSFPVLGIWLANRDDMDDRPIVDIHGGGESVLLYRTDSAVQLQLLAPAELLVFQACTGGCTLSEAFEHAAAVDPNLNLQGVLARGFALGIFCGYSFSKAPE